MYVDVRFSFDKIDFSHSKNIHLVYAFSLSLTLQARYAKQTQLEGQIWYPNDHQQTRKLDVRTNSKVSKFLLIRVNPFFLESKLEY